MGLGEFAAKKIGEEDVTIAGVTYPCVKLKFVLTMFAWAWSGYYWYEKKSGQMVQSGESKGKNVKIQYQKTA